MLVDIHAHLTHKLFKEDLDKVVERAKKTGLKAIVVSGVNPADNRRVLTLTKRCDILKASLGIYPIDALGLSDETGLIRHKGCINVEEEFAFFIKHKKVITAIGEVGLDYKFGAVYKEQQKQNFQEIINLAEKINKPLIVHSRKAEGDCIELLESSKLKKIILHCFTGKKKLLIRAKDNGWYFTIPTSVVRSQQFQEMAKIVPLSKLFCETDSPYLSPFKDKRNEPGFVVESYKKIAEIKRMELKEVVNNIFMNWQRVFV